MNECEPDEFCSQQQRRSVAIRCWYRMQSDEEGLLGRHEKWMELEFWNVEM